jgi:hypothetical protein
VENKRKQKSVLVHKSKERGGRSVITATTYSPDAKFIAGGIYYLLFLKFYSHINLNINDTEFL